MYKLAMAGCGTISSGCQKECGPGNKESFHLSHHTKHIFLVTGLLEGRFLSRRNLPEKTKGFSEPELCHYFLGHQHMLFRHYYF